jgi:IclR family transcriptional regulator, acetate operon repressor
MLRKALDAVQLVALKGELSIREIGSAMGLPKSTAHRLVTSLVEVRLLEPHRTPEGDVYAVGPLIGQLSGGGILWRSLERHAHPELTALRDETGETVGIHILYGESRVLLDQVVSHHEHRWVYNNQLVPMPLYAGAAAKMLLAILPEAEMLRIVKRNLKANERKAPGSPKLHELVEQLAVIRRQRYSVSSEEVNAGINSIAVPVTGAGNELPLSVISLAAPSIRLDEQAIKRCVRRMRQAALAIAERLSETAVANAPDGRRAVRQAAG